MYFSIQALRHFCSPDVKLPLGFGTQWLKHVSVTLSIRIFALVMLDCVLMTVSRRWRTEEPLAEEEDEGDSGLEKVDEEDVLDELLEEEEESLLPPPPKKPPKDIVVGLYRCFVLCSRQV
jgi:hypothetical protein